MAERPIWDWGLHLQADLLPLRQATRVLPVIVQDAVSNVLRNPSAFWRVGRLAATADLSAELEQLKQRGLPVVVLWGDSDRVIPYASVESLRVSLGAEEVRTVPGNHSWLLADPDGFAEYGASLRTRVAEHYRWDDVADAYQALAERLAGGWSRRREVSGRRRHAAAWAPERGTVG